MTLRAFGAIPLLFTALIISGCSGGLFGGGGDKNVTPTYSLEAAATNDCCILRVKAGPPYEDIAFKIVNQEWAFGRKRGFRTSFDRGVLQLYFNFKRHFYRR